MPSPSEGSGLPEQLESVGVLAEPARRSLYEYVVSRTEPVSREEAAEGLDMAVHSVKFHLDKLAAAGLLEVEYRRVSGRTGPGAGRPAKLYRRSDREVSLSVPPRRYDLAGEVLAEAIDRAAREGVAVLDAVSGVAHEVGRELAAATVAGAASDAGTGARRGAQRELERTGAVLGQHGYQPAVVDDELCLANCPFDRLAGDHTELVCGMNLALIDGILDGLDTTTVQARLEPHDGFCCVRVRG